MWAGLFNGNFDYNKAYEACNEYKKKRSVSDLKGRQLTQDDIGKKVFRVCSFPRPFGSCPNNFDHSYVPNKLREVKMIKFLGFSDQQLTFGDYANVREVSYYPNYNDFNWISAEEATGITELR